MGSDPPELEPLVEIRDRLDAMWQAMTGWDSWWSNEIRAEVGALNDVIADLRKNWYPE